MKQGDIIRCDRAFTANCCHFTKGEAFEVLSVGTVNARLAHVGTGSIVWFIPGDAVFAHDEVAR